MGTRHYQIVIDKEGTDRVRQYGQWDGYPEGQGVDILTFLRSKNLKEYQHNLEKIPQITETQRLVVNRDENWPDTYPWLSRDCGSRIHQMILEDKVPYVVLTSQQEANSWCEGFYTIDFQKNLFIAEYYGTKKEYPLDKLPSKAKFLKDFKQPEE